jgi:hypothetical protein
VNVFRAPEGFLIALTYGRESEWVRNVVAAGVCQQTEGERTDCIHHMDSDALLEVAERIIRDMDEFTESVIHFLDVLDERSTAPRV